MKRILLIAFIASLSIVHAQEKQKVSHELYDDWKSITSVQQSLTGAYISYAINPSRGDGTLFLEKPDGDFKKSFSRGKSGQIHYEEKFFVYLISPYFDTIRELKLDDVKEDDLPKDSLGIYWTDGDSLWQKANVKSYQIASRGNWIAFLSHDDQQPECVCKGEKKRKKCAKKLKKKDKRICGHEKMSTSGTTLTLFNPINGKEKTIHRVSDYQINETGTYLLYTQSEKGDKDTLDVKMVMLDELEEINLLEKQLLVKQITFDYSGEQASFLATADTNEKKNVDLHYWTKDENSSKVIVDSSKTSMHKGWTVSEFSRLRFSRDGSKLYFGTNEIVRPEPEDTLLESEKAKVDVWSGSDPLIQPNQLHDLQQDLKKNYLAVYHFDKNSMVQIANEKVENISTLKHENSNVALGVDSKPYHKERTWMIPWKQDVYLVDLKSGFKQLIHKGAWMRGSLSPSGEYYCWYNPEDSCWYGKHVNNREAINLTKNIDALFAADNNGQPSLAWSRGASGWTKINGHEYYIVNSEWDIYAISPANPNNSVALSVGGKKDKIQYRLWKIDHPDSVYVKLEGNLIKGRDDSTKNESVYKLTFMDRYVQDLLHETEHRIVYISKAEESDRVLFRKQSFERYAELEATDMSFTDFKVLTETNPLQKELNWGSVEFVEWKSFKGIPLRGLLYKPENFDSTKSYPMMVYFYEMYQNSYHNYYPPRATASIIYPTEYASNGYIVFIPDVRYTPGHPAKSAYDCIVSGTDYLTDKYDWIDTNRLALQGQSWGGYQTAMLVTMTDKYAAAMAGAPVSNMFSAYGGIRWGSGLSRMFQYERSQSRIGHTIWEKPELYIENSPVFHLPNVETPLLIMHNDNDGAVPWYQGIEMYMGMRRLNKEVWMLNYNGDSHNLRKLPNKKDLSIRMRQFFDHYLMDQPKPEWMEDGVPAIDKGKDFGLELEK